MTTFSSEPSLESSSDFHDSMELLRSNLSKVQIPGLTQRIYKHECCLSFDTPKSEGGLYVDLNSFLAFGKDYVAWNYKKTGNPVYFHIKQTPKSVTDDRPRVGYEESYSVVILPDFVSLQFPSVELPEKVRMAGDAIVSRVGAVRFIQSSQSKMTNSERELEQNSIDWNRLQESEKPVFGPGYTGLVNIGNSCYMSAIMQILFSTNSFVSRYFSHQSLDMAFEMASADPTMDLNMQLAKLGHGLLSGKYSIPLTEKDAATGDARQGISPRMFKSVVAASHKELSSTRQQDAFDFFLHLIKDVEKVNKSRPDLDPSRSFAFGTEEKIICSSGKVVLTTTDCEYILSLEIPLHEAINKAELKERSEENDMSSDERICPRVPLEACLANYLAPEELRYFYSTALGRKTTAIKTLGLTSFPDYLVLHMQKFTLEPSWKPQKLDVDIDVPDVIDISHMRSTGLQPGEELLPDNFKEEVMEESAKPNEEIVAELLSMGFEKLHCEKAAIKTSNAGVEEAMNWLYFNMEDPDIDTPIPSKTTNVDTPIPRQTTNVDTPILDQTSYVDIPIFDQTWSVDQSSVDMLISFGISEHIAREALKISEGDITKAGDWAFSQPEGILEEIIRKADLEYNQPESSDSSDMEVCSSNALPESELPDGGGKYKLFGIVSHIGASVDCGHYVAHILKEGRWVKFDDNKVSISTDPPKDTGYLYFFQRLQD